KKERPTKWKQSKSRKCGLHKKIPRNALLLAPRTEAAKLPASPVKFRSAIMGSGFMKKSIGRKGNAIHIRATRAARSASSGVPTFVPRNARNVSDSKLELSGVSD